MNGSPVTGLVRGWVRLHTRGVPADLRGACRDEVDDDLRCEHEDATALGRSARSLDADLVVRLLFGMPADLSWRLTYRGHAHASSLGRSSSMGPRTVGASAIIPVLGMGTMGVLSRMFGDALGIDGSFVPVGVVVGLIALIAIAFLVAAQGLDWLYQDRVSLLGNFGALVVTLGALTTFFAGFAAPVLVGSAMLLWDLARIGVVSRLVPIVHVATAILFVFGQIGFDLGGLGVIVAASFTLFVVTWGAIGVSLIRVVPQTQAPSA